ncbi:hypothetical protein [Streptomyces sp. NPDC059909]
MVVVPWIDGRAYWPRHPYAEPNPRDPETREHLGRPVAGAPSA